MKKYNISTVLAVLALFFATSMEARAQDLHQDLISVKTRMDSISAYKATLVLRHSIDTSTSEKNRFKVMVDQNRYQFEDGHKLVIMDTIYTVVINKDDSSVVVAKSRSFINRSLFKLNIDSSYDTISRVYQGNKVHYRVKFNQAGQYDRLRVEIDTSLNLIDYVKFIKRSKDNSEREYLTYKILSFDEQPTFSGADFNILRVISFNATGQPVLKPQYSSYSLIIRI